MNFTDKDLKAFIRCMVTLVYHAEKADSPGEFEQGGGSGFLVEVRGESLLITAGHVLRGMIEAATDNKLIYFAACDAWSNSLGQGHPYTLAVDPSRWSTLGDLDTLDVGAVKLGPIYAAGLKEGSAPFPETDWRNPPLDFDFYVVLGTPKQLRSSVIPEGRRFPVAYDFKRGVLSVQRIPRPDWIPSTPHDRFYGKILTNDVEGAVLLNDLRGASGGPILGCKRDSKGAIQCWPVAVQTAWYKQNKVVEGDLLTVNADWIAAQL